MAITPPQPFATPDNPPVTEQARSTESAGEDNSLLTVLGTVVGVGAGAAASLATGAIDRVLNLSLSSKPKFVPPEIPPITSPPPTLSDGVPVLSIEENSIDSQFVDGQIWKIRVELDNGSVEPQLIPSNWIHEFVLEHSITDSCYYRGSMIVVCNRFGVAGDSVDDRTPPDQNEESELVLRGDGRDIIKINIKPIFPDGTELPNEIWEINSEFVIYDSQDINWKQETAMAKKLFFWHRGYQAMIEQNAVFSTSTYTDLVTPERAPFVSNENRMMTCGLAIKKLLESAGLGDFIDYSQEGWDDGDPESKVFYTSGSNNNVLESVYELLSMYVSSNKDPGVFYFNRGTNKFQLLSLQSIFEKAGQTDPGDFYYETFYIGSSESGSEEVEVGARRTPAPQDSSLNKNINLKKYNLIRDNSYTLTDPSGAASSNCNVSQMVHTYDHKTKTFKASYERSEIKGFRDRFATDYTNKLMQAAGGEPLLPLNSTKKEQKIIRQVYSTSTNKEYSGIKEIGNNYLLMSSLLLNLGIEFKVQGSSHRHPGRFIGLDKFKNTNNKYDHRLLGQWFVTNTILRWKDSELYNEIAANKVVSFKALDFEEDI